MLDTSCGFTPFSSYSVWHEWGLFPHLRAVASRGVGATVLYTHLTFWRSAQLWAHWRQWLLVQSYWKLQWEDWNIFMEMVLLWRCPEKPLVRSDLSRAEEQSGFLLWPLCGPFTFRAAVEPKDHLAQPCHAKSQTWSMGSQAGLFPEHQRTWEPHSKALSRPLLLPPHSSVRQVTTKLGLFVLPAAWLNTSGSKGSPTVLMLARQNVVNF